MRRLFQLEAEGVSGRHLGLGSKIMAGVRLVNLSKKFGSALAVDRFSLEIADGEFLVLVGPSGCGKTTCLRMVAGLEEPSGGEIWIGDRQVNDVSPKDRDIAMVFQNYALYPHMNVYDNMAFGLKWRKLDKDEIDRRVLEAAGLLGLEALLERRPKELSGGQRQRVALGRAIVREPAVFLMDEPLSNLDAKLRVQTRSELIKLHRRLGVTTIYVTHDQVEAMTMGDRIVVMKDGLTQQVDTPMGLYQNPANRFVAGFIGSPPMNFVPVKVEAEGTGCALVASGFRVPCPETYRAALQPYVDREVIFGIRPQDIVDRCLRAGQENNFPVVEVEVEVVELMGAEAVLYLKSGADTLVASMDNATTAREGERLEVLFLMDRTHVFDAETGAAIR
jgi:multiple sugar transport system ATP-binding protein